MTRTKPEILSDMLRCVKVYSSILCLEQIQFAIGINIIYMYVHFFVVTFFFNFDRNVFLNFDKYYIKFGQTQFSIWIKTLNFWTNTFVHLSFGSLFLHFRSLRWDMWIAIKKFLIKSSRKLTCLKSCFRFHVMFASN